MNQLLRAALAATALTFAVPAFAQEPTPTDEPEAPRPGGEEQPGDTMGLREALDLDDATAERIGTIMRSAQNQARTLRTQINASIDDLRAARKDNDMAGMKTALDRFRGLHNRLTDLGTETIDRVFANLSLKQQADFALWVADENHRLAMLGEDRA